MIKSAIFALFIVAVSAAPHRKDGDFVCPEKDIADTGCKGPKDCLYPYPKNCSQFIQCTVNADGITGSPVVRDCAPARPGEPPLQWNDEEKQCDYEGDGDCDGNTTTEGPTTAEPTDAPTTQEPASSSTARPGSSSAAPTTAPPTETTTEDEPQTTQEPTKGPTKTTPAPTTPTTQKPSSSTSGSTFVCPKEDIAATACKGPKDCLYPNPESCFNYIQCTVNSDGVTGTPVVMPCAPATPPLQWNDNKKECDYASESTCKGTTPNPPSSSTTDAPQETTTGAPQETTTGAPDDTTTQAPSEETTTQGSETTTGAEGSSPTTTQKSETTTENACKPVDEDKDDEQDWDSWCGSGCKNNRTVAHPKNKTKFVQCLDNGKGVVQKCSSGLLWSEERITCEYAGLVDKNGPKSRY